MDSLTSQQCEQLKSLLDQREQVVRADIERELRLQQDEVETAGNTDDPEQSPFVNVEAGLVNAAVQREMAELRAIALARQRMENGLYGECMECGYGIPLERLRAQPIAQRCAPCQGWHEKSRA